MILGITDSETTGLSPKDNELIEVAMLIYDTETKSILESYQSLLHNQENACEHINHISPLALRKVPTDHKETVKDTMVSMATACDFVIAHNAQFDKGFYDANGMVFETPWVCSKKDLEYPGKHSSMRLGHLCYDFDIPVFNAHTALGDCMILLQLVQKIPDLEEQLKVALEPKTAYAAVVSIDDKELAKERGFSWNREKKLWIKELRDSEYKVLKTEAPFKLKKVGS